jgi:predicted O-methyltransferase YrrM
MVQPGFIPSILSKPDVEELIGNLHAMADRQDGRILERARSAAKERVIDAKERAVLLKDALLPVSAEVGKFLYVVARSMRARRIVEFGTSFGVSTLYLAAALHDCGEGTLIGSELESSKVKRARQNLAQAGLQDFAEILEGDALVTLREVAGPVDLLFLDGWKDLYLDVLLLVLPKLHSGAVVLADDLDIEPALLAGYLEYVRDPQHGFVSAMLTFGDGIEFSVRL